MMGLPFQPVRLTYGYESGDSGQNITVVNRAIGGPGLRINFTHDVEDPKGHHPNGGGISVVNGPSNATGVWVRGHLGLWICDLWAPSADARTEFQIWPSKCVVNGDGSSGADIVDGTLLAEEKYAPIQHDDLLWEESPPGSGDFVLVHNAPGHSPSVKHTYWNFTEPVDTDERLRINIAQFHDDPNVPGYGKPYPGYIRKAVLKMEVFPR